MLPQALPSLQDQINEKKKEITTDGYPMSIGELASLYKEKELDIHPEFQRFFRWSILQKSKLIESILLGIPLPSIFVSQREDGVWDVVDGLQRLSTIFEFMGILEDEKGELLPSSRLVKTEYLSSLEGKYWERENDSENSFLSSQRLSFKREKIDVKIVKKESHEHIKYELFQRLNTLGSKLSDQEVRNCLLVLIDRSFYIWLKGLSDNQNFISTLSLTERSISEQYNMELALRFLIFKNSDLNEIRSVFDLGEYITQKMILMAESPTFDRDQEAAEFLRTFELLNFCLADNAFKKYSLHKGRFEGMFLISGFEAIAIGMGKVINTYMDVPLDEHLRQELTEKVINIWSNPTYVENSGSGLRAPQRVPAIVPLGEKLFAR